MQASASVTCFSDSMIDFSPPSRNHMESRAALGQFACECRGLGEQLELLVGGPREFDAFIWWAVEEFKTSYSNMHLQQTVRFPSP